MVKITNMILEMQLFSYGLSEKADY